MAAHPAPADAVEALAGDGKMLRGSRTQDARGTHLLAVRSQRVGLTLAQLAVDDTTNEITAVHAVLPHLLLEGRVRTVDALLTQRAVARTIVDRGGDYVLVAKENQPRLSPDSAAVLTTPAPLAAPLRHTQRPNRSRGHGRLEQRRLTTRALLPGDGDGPGCQQVFRLERRVIRLKTGEIHTDTSEGITSRGTEAATPPQLRHCVRARASGIGHIENKAPWVRDVTFDADRAQVRTAAIPR